jgi:hypothetical protein
MVGSEGTPGHRPAPPLRVGVTGHRHLADADGVAREVDRVLDRLVTVHTASALTAVSSLAEGADRIVAKRVLARQGTLDVVLPLDRDDYATDFADEASRHDFLRLLDAAESVSSSARQESREAAYENAGREVLARCDVLLALWDGGPPRGRGGTAQLVTEAQAIGKPVEVVHVERAGVSERSGVPERSGDAPTPA